MNGSVINGFVVTAIESASWCSYVSVVKEFWGKMKADNQHALVGVMLSSFKCWDPGPQPGGVKISAGCGPDGTRFTPQHHASLESGIDASYDNESVVFLTRQRKTTHRVE